MKENEPGSFCPSSRQQWREWLQENHDKQASVWLIYYKMASGIPTISWTEAVEEALCFGWIDSKVLPIDGEKYMRFFSKRKAGGTWSKINKDKIQQLIDAGSMAPAGLACIEIAKQNGSWTILDEVEALVVPADLEKAFKAKRGSKKFFLSLSKSVRKSILQWVVLARREDTRKKRVQEIAELASRQLRPKL